MCDGLRFILFYYPPHTVKLVQTRDRNQGGQGMRLGVCRAAAEVIAHGRTVFSSGPPNFMHAAEMKGIVKANTPILKQYSIT